LIVIVADVVARDDGRLPHERLQRILELRPDMVLISGGVKPGKIAPVVQLRQLQN
jgi:putative cell wall-binding protein